MCNLIASEWDTPFTYAAFASVGLIMEFDGENTAMLVIAPGGLDAYPKYLVRFTDVFAVTCQEEAGASTDLGQLATPNDTFAYIWADSPHVKAYSATARAGDKQLAHYVVVGGDNIASVVSGLPPIIETVAGPQRLEARHAV